MVVGLGRQQENGLGTMAHTPRHVDECAGLAGFLRPASRRGQSPPRTVRNRSPEAVCLRSMPDITPGATSQACFPLGGGWGGRRACPRCRRGLRSTPGWESSL